MGNKKLVITLIIIVAILIVALTGAIIYIVMDKDSNPNNKLVNTPGNINDEKPEEDYEDNVEDELGDIQASLEEQEKEAFNMQFEQFENEECSAQNVKALLRKVTTSNSISENFVTLNSTGITDVSNVNSSKKYSVELSYGDNGYVEEITIMEVATSDEEIEENVDTSDDMAKAVFNAQFTSYLGKITGAQLNTLLSTIQSSNSANPDHQISLTSNNLQDLNGIVATDEYVITLSYDDNNYVKNINIDKNEI